MGKEPTETTQALAREWAFAIDRLKQARQGVSQAEHRVQCAESALGKRLDPGTQLLNELLSSWVSFGGKDERFIEWIMDADGEYRVQLRGDDPLDHLRPLERREVADG